jgi:hypothetical protein
MDAIEHGDPVITSCTCCSASLGGYLPNTLMTLDTCCDPGSSGIASLTRLRHEKDPSREGNNSPPGPAPRLEAMEVVRADTQHARYHNRETAKLKNSCRRCRSALQQ